MNNRIALCTIKTLQKLNHQTLCTIANQINSQKETNRLFSYTNEGGYVRHSPYSITDLPEELPLHQLVWRNVNKWHNKIAFICSETGRKYTYGKLRDHAAAFAIRLQHEFKYTKGDTIAICMPNVPEYPIAMFGGIEAGCIVTTMNPTYTAAEISKQLILSKAQCIIGLTENYKTIKEACELAQKQIPIICLNTLPGETNPTETINFFQLTNTEGVDFSKLIEYNFSIDDICVLPYSSGTTGLPKGVMLTHRALGTNSFQTQAPIYERPLVKPTEGNDQECLINVLPYFHIYSMNCSLITSTRIGCKNVSVKKYTANHYVDSVKTEKGTVLHTVPPIMLMLINTESVKPTDLNTVTTILCGAAPLGALDVDRFFKKFSDIDYIQGYGLTEASPVTHASFRGCTNYSTIGSPLPLSDAKIVKIDDKHAFGLGPNEVGELLVRGPNVMKGYFDNKEATDEVLIADNWLRTGDSGYYDEQGFFYITDRLKELIKVKAFQVAPAELEEVIRDHEGVLDAAVVGAPHPRHGEQPRAFVVRRPNSKVTEDDIKNYVAKKLTAFKHLTGGVIFLDEIPKNASGKILRRQLKEQYCQ